MDTISLPKMVLDGVKGGAEPQLTALDLKSEGVAVTQHSFFLLVNLISRSSRNEKKSFLNSQS